MQMPPNVPGAMPAGTYSPDGQWVWSGREWVSSAPVATRTYLPTRTRSRVAIAALVAVGLMHVIGLFTLLGRLDIVRRLTNGEFVSAGEANDSDNFVRTVGFVTFAATVVCGVLFLMWLYRTVANNHALGARALQFSPGASVWWWFCPIANWVRPFQILRETWRAANPSAPGSTPDQRQLQRTPIHLIVWGLCWFAVSPITVFVYLSNASQPDAFDPAQRLNALQTQTIAELVNAVIWVVAAVLAVVIVSRINARQQRLLSVVSQTPAPGPAAAVAPA